MEATTTTYSREYTPVGFGGAFARQFHFLWTSRRPVILAVALLAVLVLAGDPWTADIKMRLFSPWPVWFFVVPIAWAFAVLHNEGPSNRLYFWSHPAGRTNHILARLAAGLAWLWIAYAGLIFAGWIFGLADGDAWHMTELGFTAWMSFFIGPMLVYLSVALLTVPSDYPIRWFFGIMFAVPLLVSLLVDWLDVPDSFLERVFAPLINEDWGFFSAAMGPMMRNISELETTIRVMANPDYVGRGFDGAALWGVAMPAWVIVTVAVVAFVATRHPDTLPKWRGFRR